MSNDERASSSQNDSLDDEQLEQVGGGLPQPPQWINKPVDGGDIGIDDPKILFGDTIA